MLNLRFWLSEQGLSVREFAIRLEIPLATVEDWVYRGASPSPRNMSRLTEFIKAECKHHWVIESANGPVSVGVCQRCGEERGFRNSADTTQWLNPIRPRSEVKES